MFLLYTLSFIPLGHPVYGRAINAARTAAFKQSGVEADWSVVRSGAEHRVPPALRTAGAVGAIVYKREIDLRSSLLHITASPTSARAVLTLQF